MSHRKEDGLGEGRGGGGGAAVIVQEDSFCKAEREKRPKPNFKTIISNQIRAGRSETGMGGAGRGEERRREEEADSEEKPLWPFLTSSVSVSVAISSSLPPDQITAPVFSRVNTKAHQDQSFDAPPSAGAMAPRRNQPGASLS